jgi:hypothetical protein
MEIVIVCSILNYSKANIVKSTHVPSPAILWNWSCWHCGAPSAYHYWKRILVQLANSLLLALFWTQCCDRYCWYPWCSTINACTSSTMQFMNFWQKHKRQNYCFFKKVVKINGSMDFNLQTFYRLYLTTCIKRFIQYGWLVIQKKLNPLV